MSPPAPYLEQAPNRADVEQQAGFYLLEFGADWCGHCQAAQSGIIEALNHHPTLLHHKIEDGPGRRLGRSFRVKLWPTLILLNDGIEVGRVVRPVTAAEVSELLDSVVK